VDPFPDKLLLRKSGSTETEVSFSPLFGTIPAFGLLFLAPEVSLLQPKVLTAEHIPKQHNYTPGEARNCRPRFILNFLSVDKNIISDPCSETRAGFVCRML
jgi:hypothetical protein